MYRDENLVSKWNNHILDLFCWYRFAWATDLVIITNYNYDKHFCKISALEIYMLWWNASWDELPSCCFHEVPSADPRPASKSIPIILCSQYSATDTLVSVSRTRLFILTIYIGALYGDGTCRQYLERFTYHFIPLAVVCCIYVLSARLRIGIKSSRAKYIIYGT